ncbi:MAG: hypothetical protein ACTSU7_00230 [Candidatus Heimdallarchaeaceae archaeon]
MAQVTYANLFSEPRNNVVDLITANVSDPLTSSSEFRKWIYSRVPDIKSSDFAGYPLIIIYPVEFEARREETNAKGDAKEVFWTMEIEIITSDRGIGDSAGKGLVHMDSISDDIISVLLNVSNRATLRNYGMSSEVPETSEVVTETLKDELVYRRSISVGFTNRMVVSS